MIQIITHSVDDTKALAESIGRVLKGGEIFEMISDIGGGKTAFVKGLARGLAITEVVQSPTFTISRIYMAREGLELHHFDFYRLQEAGVVAAELAESLVQRNAIVAVEWGGIVHDIVPKASIKVSITSIDETTRRIAFDIPGQASAIAHAVTSYNATRHLA